jgi:hypothetical protein
MTKPTSILRGLIGLGLLAAIPSFQGPSSIAQAAVPIIQGDCTISWNPNTEADLAGYRLYLGRLFNQLSQVKDLGNRTTIRCSEANAVATGRWFAAVTAYDDSGNESPISPLLPFELAGTAPPMQGTNILEPALAQLRVHTPGFQLRWLDRNVPLVAHRIELSSSLHPAWTSIGLLPAGLNRFANFHSSKAEWVCYRVRAEQGTSISPWAQASGPDDRQFCVRPEPVPVIEQPILASTVLYEPRQVKMIPAPPGFRLTWTNTSPAASHRIEFTSSMEPAWEALAVVPPGVEEFRYGAPIDVSICLRVRAEVGRFVSLWATATPAGDREVCFNPSMLPSSDIVTSMTP